jgi:hypothetical protein
MLDARLISEYVVYNCSIYMILQLTRVCCRIVHVFDTEQLVVNVFAKKKKKGPMLSFDLPFSKDQPKQDQEQV